MLLRTFSKSTMSFRLVQFSDRVAMEKACGNPIPLTKIGLFPWYPIRKLHQSKAHGLISKGGI